MKQLVGTRITGMLLGALIASLALSGGSASARSRGRLSAAGSITQTFSFIGKANSKASTIVNVDSLLINARCDSRGEPVIYGFTSASAADIFGRLFDGFGRLHVIHNSAFTKQGKGVRLSATSGDFDSTATVLFETSAGKVVTVNLASDNSTTLVKQNVCTVFGSFVAS